MQSNKWHNKEWQLKQIDKELGSYKCIYARPFLYKTLGPLQRLNVGRKIATFHYQLEDTDR